MLKHIICTLADQKRNINRNFIIYTMDGDEIQTAQCYKYLGIWLDEGSVKNAEM